MELSDQQLLTNWCALRDAHAFQAIVQRHAPMVFHTALRILRNQADAEDATQECFETLVATKETSHILSLGAWLHGMATNRSLNHVRASSRRSAREERYAAFNQKGDDVPEWREIVPIIDEAIQSLDERYRVPLVAHFLTGRTHASIAEELHVSRTTISARINQGVGQIEAVLKKKGIVPSVGLTAILTSQLGNAAMIETSIVANLGKLALAQGQSVSVVAQGAVAKTGIGAFAKWAAVLLVLAGGATFVSLRPNTAEDTQAPPVIDITDSASAAVSGDTPAGPTGFDVSNDTSEGSEREGTGIPAMTDSDSVFVSGVALDVAGNPMPNAQVDATWSTGESFAIADEEGRFRVGIAKNTFGDGKLIFSEEPTLNLSVTMAGGSSTRMYLIYLFTVTSRVTNLPAIWT